MSRTVWRIGADTPDYEADDLTGAGAKATGGRWNDKELAVLYTSESRALACMETLVHFKAGGLPLNRYLVRIDIPEAVWAKAQTETEATMPVGWDAEPAGRASLRFGSDWLKGKATALLILPSVIVPEELNILINPIHPDSRGVSATKVRRWNYDARFGKSGGTP